MKKGLLTMAGVLLTVSLVSAGTTVPVLAEEETTLVYGSGDYTRINPAHFHKFLCLDCGKLCTRAFYIQCGVVFYRSITTTCKNIGRVASISI